MILLCLSCILKNLVRGFFILFFIFLIYNIFIGDIMKCNLCKRCCNIDRSKSLGFCKSSNTIKIAKVMLYHYEEPCISGKNGSGTIFFSNCNMKCVFCQNYDISTLGIGKEVPTEKFADLLISLQKDGAHNINLVTPGHYAHLIKDGIILAKEKGLSIPIVYNTNSYENVDTIKSLNGLIDVYLPDFKYYDDKYAIKYSSSPGYSSNAKLVINEMFKQVGPPIFKDNMMVKGVLVRHLMLPTLTRDTKNIINYLYSTYGDNIFLSIMNQYTPMKKFNDPVLDRKVSKREYEMIINYAYDIGVRNAFVQDEGTCKKSFIPDFRKQNF